MSNKQRRGVSAYLRAKAELEDIKAEEQQRFASSFWQSLQQYSLSITLMILAIPVLLWFFGTLMTAPCITNFYSQMPIYPDAELVDTSASFWNWFGLGSLSETYRSPSALADVQQWYAEQIAIQEEAWETGRRQGADIPKWEGTYTVQQRGDTVVIEKVSTCFIRLRQ